MSLSRIEFPLSDTEQDYLLSCVSAVIRHQLKQPLPATFAFLTQFSPQENAFMEAIASHCSTFAPRLLTPCGAFVTLHTRTAGIKMLRGCIGLMETTLPLVLTVVQMAWAAAFSDHRFMPLHVDELEKTEADISILGPLSSCMPQDVILGKHGIRLEAMGRSSVFLPEVPVEQHWTMAQTLEALCHKAGLSSSAASPEAFATGHTRLYCYETTLFGPQIL